MTFETWFDDNVYYDLYSNLQFKTLYNSYSDYCFSRDVVAVTSKSFSIKLRSFLKKSVEAERVRFTRNSGVVVAGLALKTDQSG